MDLMHILYKEEWVTEKADISMTLKQGNHTILLVEMHQKEFYRLDQSFNLKRPDNREDIFSGRSIGRNVYIGFVEDGFTPINKQFGTVWGLKYGGIRHR